MTTQVGSLPFVAEDNGKKLASLPRIVKRGLGPRHYSSLLHVSLEARIVIMRCLVVDPKKRVSFEDAVKSPWLALHMQGEAGYNTASVAVPTYEDERKVARDLKDLMGIKSDPEGILTYVKKKRPFGTTAGCFNILALDQENRNRNREVFNSRSRLVSQFTFQCFNLPQLLNTFHHFISIWNSNFNFEVFKVGL